MHKYIQPDKPVNGKVLDLIQAGQFIVENINLNMMRERMQQRRRERGQTQQQSIDEWKQELMDVYVKKEFLYKHPKMKPTYLKAIQMRTVELLKDIGFSDFKQVIDLVTAYDIRTLQAMFDLLANEFALPQTFPYMERYTQILTSNDVNARVRYQRIAVTMNLVLKHVLLLLDVYFVRNDSIIFLSPEDVNGLMGMTEERATELKTLKDDDKFWKFFYELSNKSLQDEKGYATETPVMCVLQ